MHEKYLKSLEFDKILNTALSYVLCEEARELLQNETPGETAEDVRLLLQRTDEITTLLIKNGSPRFSHVDHVAFTLQRAVKGGVLSMGELLEIAATLRNFRELSGWYHITEHDALSIDDLFYAMTPQPGLEKAIGEAILSETEMADTASDTLYDVRRKIRAAENSIRDKLDHLTKSQANAKYLQESVVSLRNGRFVVPVKAEYRGEIGGVIHDVSSSGSTLFVEPTAVVEANAKILQLRNQEQQEIERILAAFSAQCANLEPMFSFGYEAMLKIDALLAKAHLALEQKAMCPSVRDDVSFSLVRARHPLIDPEKVVPIDVELGRTYDTMVITGPNTGGKTVTLKTAGLLCTMARFGYLIPAHESSEVCVFDEILVDIGDEQSIEQSLSTFSGHMKNITEILACAGPRSLVLMDELGAGTDPAEGAALAVSIIEELREKGAHVMATTHYAEMKTFALETPGVQNASCEFNVETLRPTYRISVGVPGKSNAFLISAKLGISEHIIERAKTHLSEEDRQFDAVLAQLEDLKAQLKEKQEQVEELQHSAENEMKKAQEKCRRLVEQGEIELAAAREKAQQMAQDVQSQAYALMDEMRKLEKAQNQSAQQRAQRAKEIAKKEAEKLFTRSDVVHAPQKQFTPLKSVTVGQEVYLVDLDKTGVVCSKPDRDNMVEIRAGILKTKVALNRLAAPQKHQPAKKQPKYTPRKSSGSSSFGERAARSANMEINLLGMTVEEALMEADRFIDNGVMSGQSTLYLIHGRGTGALRKAIQSHLRRHPSVKSYRLGVYGEGEDGVTVVELK